MAKYYECTITLQKPSRTGFIPAGTAFVEGDISKGVFDRLVMDGCIFEYGNAKKEVPVRPIRELVNRLGEDGKQKETNFKQTPPKVVPEGLWDGDPNELKEFDITVLYTEYAKTCEQYNISPVRFDSKEELIKEMSKDFVPEKA
jgi:hypothetical protein